MSPRVSNVPDTHRRKPLRTLSFFLLFGLAAAAVGYQFSSHFAVRTFPGRVMGTETDVSPTNPGRILNLMVEQNAAVKAGDIMAQLQDEAVAAEIRAASDEILSLETSLLQAGSDPAVELQKYDLQQKISETRSEMNRLDYEDRVALNSIVTASAAQTISQDKLMRAEKLFAGGALPIDQLEARRLEVAESNRALQTLNDQLAQSQERREFLLGELDLYRRRGAALEEKSNQALTDLELSIRQKRGVLNTLLARQSELVLRAPTDGIVSQIFKSVGEFVDSGEAVLNIYTGERLWVDIRLPPQDSSLMQEGDPVGIQVDSVGRVRLEATVQSVSPVIQSIVDTSNPFGAGEASYLVALAQFNDLERAKALVRKGQNVTAILLTHRH